MPQKFVTKEFPKEDLLDVIDDMSESLTCISNKIADKNRWTVEYDLTFRENSTGLTYQVYYSVGATEYQDEGPFSNEGDMIECTQMEEVEELVKVYKPLKR